MRIAIDIDSTLHHYWDRLSDAAQRRFGVDLPYEEQFDWGITRLKPRQLELCIQETHSDEAIAAGEPYPGAVEAVARCTELAIDLLIDDSPVNLERALDAGLRVATIGHPWNREVCETEDVICAEDWAGLEAGLAPLLGMTAQRR